MIPLINKQIKSYEKQKVCRICKKELRDDDKKRKKSEIIVTISESSEDLVIVFAV